MRLRYIGLLLIALSLVLSACGRGGGQTETIEFKLGNATAKDAQDETANFFVKEVARLTNNRVKGTVFNGSQLGNSQQMNQAVRAGTQEMVIQPTGFMATYVPQTGVLDLPFLFKNDEQQVTILNGPAGDAIRKAAEAEGVVILTFIAGGFKDFSTTFPISSVADLQGKKLRVIQSPELVAQFKAFGLAGIPMALPEVYTSIQQGAVQGQENPVDVIYTMKFHEVAPHFTISQHGALSSVIGVSKKWFDAQPADVQKALREAGQSAGKEALKIYKSFRDKSLDELKKAGGKVATLPAAEVEKLRGLSKQVWDEVRKDAKKAPVLETLEKATK